MQSSKLELDEIKKSISSIEGVLSSLREKIEKIDDKYPRRAGVPLKKPLR